MQETFPDFRDNRGKKHDLLFILIGVLFSVLYGKLLVAEIHRYLERHHKTLCKLMGVKSKESISDPQLRRILSSVDAMLLQKINSSYLVFLFQTFLKIVGLALMVKKFVAQLTEY